MSRNPGCKLHGTVNCGVPCCVAFAKSKLEARLAIEEADRSAREAARPSVT